VNIHYVNYRVIGIIWIIIKQTGFDVNEAALAWDAKVKMKIMRLIPD